MKNNLLNDKRQLFFIHYLMNSFRIGDTCFYTSRIHAVRSLSDYTATQDHSAVVNQASI